MDPARPAARSARPPRRGVRLATALAAAAAALVAAPSSARAGTCEDRPQVSPCLDADTLRPNPGPMRFTGVSSTETVAQGQITFGLVGTYLNRPVVLRTPSPGPPGGSDQPAVEHLLNGTFLWGYGVTDRLELDLAVPITFYQDGSGTNAVTGGRSLRETALRDVRFGVAYAIVPRARVAPETDTARGPGHDWALTARFVTGIPTADRGDFTGARGGVLGPSVTGDVRLGRVLVATEVGLRLRPTSELVGARVGSELALAIGASYDILDRGLLSAGLEARALYGLVEQATAFQGPTGLRTTPNGSHILPAEWAATVRTAPLQGGDLAFFVSGGGALPLDGTPITTPAGRVVFGFTLAPLGLDSDHDGVPDKVDRCPGVPMNGKGPKDGCPHDEPAEAEVPR